MALFPGGKGSEILKSSSGEIGCFFEKQSVEIGCFLEKRNVEIGYFLLRPS